MAAKNCKMDANEKSKDTEEPFQKVTYKKNHSSTTNKRGRKSKKSITIVGDSIIKDIKNHLPTFDNAKVTVNSYPGATTQQLYTYTQSFDLNKPDAIIIHIGTNDLTMNENDAEVADNIINFATYLNGKYDVAVIISSLTYRIDFKYKHSRRIKAVNDALKSRCENLDLGYIENDNIKKYYLGSGGVLLNKEGSAMLTYNFERVINILNFNNNKGKQQSTRNNKKKSQGR
uniref:SGNH hydrolase-type esterase domain-containing protein n=1 Tax=Clytia hemisphaerica TaxID=252671 RepID=A0A7M5WYG9_9CNID